MRIVFCGGGTGGHITPALAMADILRQNEKNVDFAFIGRRGGKENDAVRATGIKLYELEVVGLKRSLSLSNVSALFCALKARDEAKRLLKDLRPDAVIGTGGYVSWPVLSAAHSLGVRCAIHESNAYPGFVTRNLSGKCELVMLGYQEAAEHLGTTKNVKVTGNPVRSRVGKIGRVEARRELGIPIEARVVLSFGGSLGAQKINEVMREVMETGGCNCFFIHATGRREFQGYGLKSNMGRLILPYIEDMPTYLAAADVAITRCGAMTLAELCTAGVPSILIPSPNVTDNHQYKNAKALAESGAAVLIEERELTGNRLSAQINNLLDNGTRRQQMHSRLCSRARGTGGRILLAIRELVKEK